MNCRYLVQLYGARYRCEWMCWEHKTLRDCIYIINDALGLDADIHDWDRVITATNIQEAAKTGEFVRPSERRRQMLESQGSGNGIPGLVGGGTGDPYRCGCMGYAAFDCRCMQHSTVMCSL